MLRITELKAGEFISLNNKPYEILHCAHQSIGRGAGIVKTKLRDLKTAAIIEKTFKGQDRIEEASLELIPCQFIYRRSNEFYFMDSKNFEEFCLSKSRIGSKDKFLKEEINLEAVFTDKEPVSMNLPIKLDFEVTDTEPGVKGDTAGAATKEATIETGFKLQVPLFIKKGDIIKIDTRTGKYFGRVR